MLKALNHWTIRESVSVFKLGQNSKFHILRNQSNFLQKGGLRRPVILFCIPTPIFLVSATLHYSADKLDIYQFVFMLILKRPQRWQKCRKIQALPMVSLHFRPQELRLFSCINRKPYCRFSLNPRYLPVTWHFQSD